MKRFGLKDNGPLNNNEKTSLSSLNLNESSKQLEPNSAPILSESPLMNNSSTVPPSNKNVVPHLNKKIESITKKEPKPSNIKKSYTQASKANISMNIECYNSMLKVLSKKLTLVLSDTRELDRVPSTK